MHKSVLVSGELLQTTLYAQISEVLLMYYLLISLDNPSDSFICILYQRNMLIAYFSLTKETEF